MRRRNSTASIVEHHFFLPFPQAHSKLIGNYFPFCIGCSVITLTTHTHTNKSQWEDLFFPGEKNSRIVMMMCLVGGLAGCREYYVKHAKMDTLNFFWEQKTIFNCSLWLFGRHSVCTEQHNTSLLSSCSYSYVSQLVGW